MKSKENPLRKLPGVDRILEAVRRDPSFMGTPRSVIVAAARTVIETIRKQVLQADASAVPKMDEILSLVKQIISRNMQPNLRRVINATGVVVHTNLGRSLLHPDAAGQIAQAATAYSNLEFDITTGKRGLRYSIVEDILCEISGAEAAMVVNNNAAAVLLCLETLAAGKEVIVSRGELVEIGGSFRIPDVMAKSGAVLKEVGTTNRTHPRDYENAISDHTGLLLKVHTSNYAITGFTAEVSLPDMAALGRQYHIPVMEDLGSGTFTDFSRYGLTREPTVQDSVKARIDVVTFSGDKLLGGPQAGLIVGRKSIIEAIRKNPLTRALRIDKLTLAALENTLRLYRDPEKAARTIPTLRMITDSPDHVAQKADRLIRMLETIPDKRLSVSRMPIHSKTGGGALPLLNLPSMGVGIRIENMTADGIEKAMRGSDPPVIGRIEDDLFLLDPRTILETDMEDIQAAVQSIL